MTARDAVRSIEVWARERDLDFRHDGESGHGAVFSRCGRYRYLLWRDADAASRFLAIAMLNPSRADHLHNDATIGRCHGRARDMGGALLVWNLFALREKSPAILKRRRGPVGRHNPDAIRLALKLAPRTIAAWGVHGAHRGQGAAVLRTCRDAGVTLECYGTTKDGHPRHPLYLKSETRPRAYTV